MRTNHRPVDMYTNWMRFTAGALLVAAAGCGVDGAVTEDRGAAGATQDAFNPPALSAADDQELNLRATIEIPNRAVVKFYEPQAGLIFVTEAGRNDNPSVLPSDMRKLSAVDLYEGLSHQKAPLGLVQATSRAAQLQQRLAWTDRPALPADAIPTFLRAPKTEAVPGAEGIQAVSSAATFASSYDQWFYDNFCSGGANVGSNWSWSIQWMFVSGTGKFTRYDNNWVNSTVSVYAGAVHHKVEIQPWYSWSTPKDLTIQAGYYLKYSRIDYSVDFDLRVTTDNASAASYHWCAYGSN